MRVLLVEPYLGGSHADWAAGLARHSAHEVTVVGHPGRHWRWRMRGGPVTLAEQAAAVVAEHGRPDVVLVSGLTDLAAFCGLSRRWLGDTPVALYLHESQLLHPGTPAGSVGAEGVFANWRSMVAADHVFVASEFHRRELFAALPAALADVPDEPHGHLLPAVEARTTVLPVGVELAGLLAADRPAPDGGRRSWCGPTGGTTTSGPRRCCACSSPWPGPTCRSGWPSPGPTPGRTRRSSTRRSPPSVTGSCTSATCPAPSTRRCCCGATSWSAPRPTSSSASPRSRPWPPAWCRSCPTAWPTPSWCRSGSTRRCSTATRCSTGCGPCSRTSRPPAPGRGAARVDPALLVGGGRAPVRRRARGARRPLGTLTRRR